MIYAPTLTEYSPESNADMCRLLYLPAAEVKLLSTWEENIVQAELNIVYQLLSV